MDDKVTNKSKQLQKEPLDERKRDRGDNFKKQDSIKNKIGEGVNLKFARKPLLQVKDQGDVLVINKDTKVLKVTTNINKINRDINDKSKKQIEIKTKLTAAVSSKVNTGAEKISPNKTSEINNATVNKTKLGEKNVSDKVNSRPKGIINQNQGKDTNKYVPKSDLKTDRLKYQLSLKSASKEIMTDTIKPAGTKTDSDLIKKEKNTTGRRKPMIKTVKSKNDNRVYKAVTFTEQKQTKPTVLEINIPSTQTKKAKLVDKNLEAKPASIQGTNNKSTSKLNMKINPYNRRNKYMERIKFKKLNRCNSSPDKFKKAESPPTEVAKWAPSCLNTHTKPYYEAWVNTTLAAISKISEKDKLFFEKQNIIKTFQKSLETEIKTPDLVHNNYTDECYTGRIKVKQRNLSKMTRQPLIAPLIDSNKACI